MPVNSTHPDYDAALPDWLRARDVLSGENAVKSGGEKYLPRLDSQTDEEFLAYRKRAAFFNATARSAEGSRPAIDKLPLQDVIAVNLDHYRLDADYKHGLHFTALPTAWVSGFDKSATLRIGSSTAWMSDKPGATAGYLEFTGQGLTSFERAMDRDERLLAVLGSRLLQDQKKVGETAEAIRLRQSGEESVLSAIAASVSESLTQVLRWVYWWNSTEALPTGLTKSEVTIKLNNDFGLAGMTAQDLAAVVSAWQANAISKDTMFELFRRGEILPDGRTNQDEAALIGNDQPSTLNLRPMSST